MKTIFFLAALMFTQAIIAEEYFLEFYKTCSTTGNKLDFKCKKSKSERVLIFTENNKWYGKNSEKGTGSIWELSIVKSDQHVLILDNPVFFSGTSVIHLMKTAGNFYWSEFAYSEILKEMEGTVRYGKISKINK